MAHRCDRVEQTAGIGFVCSNVLRANDDLKQMSLGVAFENPFDSIAKLSRSDPQDYSALD